MVKLVSRAVAVVASLIVITLTSLTVEAGDVEEKTSESKNLPYANSSAQALELHEGYFSIIPLDFTPTSVLVGDPKVAGVDVYMHKTARYPFVHVVGQSVGATNLVIFDQLHKMRVSMEITVSPRSYGARDEIAVYRGTNSFEFVCSSGKCDKVENKPQ